jgi:hypothetical protein
MTQEKSAREEPKDRPYFLRTGQGFKLIGFSYHPEMDPAEKTKAIQALKEALALLEAELKGGAGK